MEKRKTALHKLQKETERD